MNFFRLKYLTLSFSLLGFLSCFGQNIEPLELAKKIFATDGFAKIENYSTGEYKGRPNGQDLQKGATTKLILIGQTDQTAVVGMTILDSVGKGLDSYLHFKNDSIWKMNAFRSLAMTGIIAQIIKELEKMTPDEIDEKIKQSNATNGKVEMFKSKQAYNFGLGNAKLTLDLDENIIQHFLTNEKEFERLKDLALEEVEKRKEERKKELIKNYQDDYQKLFISSVSINEDELGNNINFLIGGILDNTVGYIYVKDKKNLPKMNPSRIIMIKEMRKGWYLYKTT